MIKYQIKGKIIKKFIKRANFKREAIGSPTA